MTTSVPSTPHVPARRRPRRRLATLVAALAAVLAPLGAAVSEPVSAAPPDGSPVELSFMVGTTGPGGIPESVPATQGWFSNTAGDNGKVSVDLVSGTAQDLGCSKSELTFAFTPASADPSQPGSAERPLLRPGDTTWDAFAWYDAGTPLDGAEWSGVWLYTKAEVEATLAEGVDRGSSISKRWPAGELISLVVFCTSGADANGFPLPRVDADGYAITSWLQFTTVASKTDPTMTSDGFQVGTATTTPTLTLADRWDDDATGTLTATLTGEDGAPLTDATGTVTFSSRAGSAWTPVGDPVDVDPATGTATLALTGLAPGSQTVFQATYTPDADASIHYATATSARFTVVAPGGDAPPEPPEVDGPTDGSDWGPIGTLASNSAVTLRWDNAGNPSGGVVPRNQRQVIAHTAKKNYFDIRPAVLDDYDRYFGSDNGLGGLRVTVSQTRDLVNQSVTLDFAGVLPDRPAGNSRSNAYFQVFQCWGAPRPDGKPDPSASDPDPATCQVGVSGPDGDPGNPNYERRSVVGDPLAAGGDWEPYADTSADIKYVPFRSITGETVPGGIYDNPLFNPTTTNELSHVIVNDAGTATRQFELHTGSESSGLGCGARSDAPSTRVCWLVIVPRIDNVMRSAGPIAPSVWAQRLQVPLTFQDVAPSCPDSRSRSLLGGSEMLVRAAASWTPGACDATQVSLGYSQYGDEVARNQYTSGGNDAILTSEPVPADAKAAHVPLALTAPVITYNLDYFPSCSGQAIGEVDTDAEARTCGYDSLADLKADLDRKGEPVRDLRLNARLVAKLLTQSYGSAIMQDNFTPRWVKDRPETLFADPEFKALNPHLHFPIYGPLGDNRSGSTLLVEAMRSDAAAQVWRWLLADPAAASFLSGCPDAHGLTINPFYSTRTYTGCADQAGQLDAKASRDRSDTPRPLTFIDQPLVYPPDGTPYPLPEWLHYTRNGQDGENSLLRSQTDWLPRVDSMPLAARATFTGGKPANTEWCATQSDSDCQPAPGKWKPGPRPRQGVREAFAISDSSSAARYALPTAKLCDPAGRHCVGATTTTVRAAARLFPRDAQGLLRPGPAAYAKDAYPLAMPVYAAVRPTLSRQDRYAYADAFDYIVAAGQKPGYRAGTLPPGYAPLTKNLSDLAAAGITALRAGVAAAPRGDAQGSHGGGDAGDDTSTGGGGSQPTGPSAPGVSTPNGTTPAAAPGTTAGTPAGTPAATPGALAPAAAGSERWPRWLLPLGLVIALLAGLAGPMLRSRTRWKLR